MTDTDGGVRGGPVGGLGWYEPGAGPTARPGQVTSDRVPRPGFGGAGRRSSGTVPSAAQGVCRQAGQVGRRLGRRAPLGRQHDRVVPERGAHAQRDALVRRVRRRQTIAAVRAVEAALRGVPQIQPGPGGVSEENLPLGDGPFTSRVGRAPSCDKDPLDGQADRLPNRGPMLRRSCGASPGDGLARYSAAMAAPAA